MSMGRRAKQRQEALWVEASRLAKGPGHPFYGRLNEILARHDFDSFAESICQEFYAEGLGRPSLPPGVYFRLMLIGYFEGIDSERGIAWRVADSLTLRDFLGYAATEEPPDHSTISRNRRLLSLEAHRQVFTWVLQVLAKERLLRGKTLGIDATTLEANAALRSIVRRDTGESYEQFLTGLAKASGIETPTRRGLGSTGPQTAEEGIESGVEEPVGYRREDHENERRSDSSGAQVRACGGYGDGCGGGGDPSACRSRRLSELGGHLGGGDGSPQRRARRRVGGRRFEPRGFGGGGG